MCARKCSQLSVQVPNLVCDDQQTCVLWRRRWTKSWHLGQTEHSSQEPDDSAEDACLDIVNSGEDEDARSQAKVDTPQAVGVDTGTSEAEAEGDQENEGEAEGDQENDIDDAPVGRSAAMQAIMADSGDEHFGDFGIDDEALLAHVY